ncbi:MAG TPA: hypothetical protein VFV34_08390 [Blastocatellia bacterium]|nr:hypothetical protein [Blastocatellia bacterium]
MAITVKRITLWRGEIENRPGTLAGVLAPLVEAGTDLQVLMGYGHEGGGGAAVVELSPVSGGKPTKAAKNAGLGASAIPTLFVEGDNKKGLAHAMARAVADAGINIHFLVAQAVGRRFSAVFGFGSDDDARKASALIKKAAGKKK